jgi:hypothetical protein
MENITGISSLPSGSGTTLVFEYKNSKITSAILQRLMLFCRMSSIGKYGFKVM